MSDRSCSDDRIQIEVEMVRIREDNQRLTDSLCMHQNMAATNSGHSFNIDLLRQNEQKLKFYTGIIHIIIIIIFMYNMLL